MLSSTKPRLAGENLISIMFFFLLLTQVFYAQKPNNSMMQSPVQVTYETGGVSDFVWSPDGNQFAYIALYNDTTRLYRIDINGSNKTELCNNAFGQIDWKDTVIAFMSYDPAIPSYNNLIKKINPDGSGISTIIGPYWYTGVYLRADANWILYRRAPNGWWAAMRCDINGGNILKLNPDSLVQQVGWFGTNQILYSRGNDYNTPCGIYKVNFDGSGNTQLTPENLPNNSTFIASPDSDKILYCDGTGNNWDIWIMDTDGNNKTQLTFDPARDYLSNTRDNVWSADGQSFYFVSDRSGNGDIYQVNIDGSNLTQITTHDSLDHNPIISPDGTKLAFLSKRDGVNNIWVIDLFPLPVGWIQQNSGTTNDLEGVSFINANIGWVAGYGSTILKTTNGGSTWIQQYSGSPFLHDIQFIDANNGIAVGTSDLIFRTTNGGTTWSSQTSGFGGEFFDVCFIDANNATAVGSVNLGGTNYVGIIIRTTDSGITWFEQPTGTTEELRGSSFIDVNNGWVVGFNGRILKTTNGGTTWIPQVSGTSNWLSAVNFFDANNGIAVSTSDLILRTTNGGANWLSQASGLAIGFMDICFINANIATAVGQAWLGGSDYRGIIIRTTNGGVTWYEQPTGTTETMFRGVSFTDENNGTVVGNNGTIFRTWNGGIPVELTSFTASINKNTVNLNWTTATELNNKGFEIERQVGSKQSSIGKWEKIGFVPGSGTTTEPRSYSYIDRDLDAGSYSYRLKQIDYDGTFEYSEEVEVEIESITPNEFSLEQNYPNPFNPVTIIKYSLPAKNLVTLKVFNILGEEVKTLVNEIKEAGCYEVEFNAANLSSGIYFYTLKSGEFVSTKKMLLLK